MYLILPMIFMHAGVRVEPSFNSSGATNRGSNIDFKAGRTTNDSGPTQRNTRFLVNSDVRTVETVRGVVI